MDELSLLADGMLIVWKWDQFEFDKHKQSDSDKDSASDCDSDTEVTHTLIFKCIGTTKEHMYQETLRLISQLPVEDVDVTLKPEPDNPYDSKAIAFIVNLDGKDCRIGYVIRELLDEVHQALNNHTIRRIKFAWVKYIVEWPRSGPGYYCGISITKKGKWSNNAVKFQSTRST